MTHSPVEIEVIALLEKLPLPQQYSVLAFVRALATPQGTPGHQLLAFAGVIDPDDSATMSQVIEQDCERINHDEW
jgi:hypothetical protein